MDEDLENALGKLKKALNGTADTARTARPTEIIRNADELLLHHMQSAAAGGVASFFRFGNAAKLSRKEVGG